ncbi:hypothetical protein EGW08_017694, partial [Elysia chlorotica]
HHWRALSGLVGLASSTTLGPALQTSFLLLLELRAVPVHESEQLGDIFTRLPVKSLCELVDGRRDLQTLVKDSPLSLQANVLGPSHKTAEVTLWLDILTDAKVLWPFFEEGVYNLLGFNFLCDQRGRSHLLLPLL